MNSLENLCFGKVRRLFEEKEIKVEQFRSLPENLLERVCGFIPTPQQIRVLGVCVRWMRGVLREKGFYVNGKLEGPFIKWDEQGRVLEQAEYKAGMKEGERVLYEPSVNRVYSIETYRQDLLHGESVTFVEGRPYCKTKYSRGELHGVKLLYFPDTQEGEEQKVWKQKCYHRGLKDGRVFWFDQQGCVTKEELWVRGILVNDVR